MNIYMQVQGIDGEVTAQGFSKWIQLESYDFEGNRQMNTRPGVVTSREGTRPSFSDFVITKFVDSATPKLLSQFTTGKALSKVVISAVTTGAQPTAYLTFTLTNAMVSGFQSSQDILPNVDGNVEQMPHKPLETLKFNYTEIEVKYVPFDATHGAGSPEIASYNLQTAQAGG